MPLVNKHFLELEGQQDCNWGSKSDALTLQARWSPCSHMKGLLKLNHGRHWTGAKLKEGQNPQSWVLHKSLSFTHPKLENVTLGLSGDYDLVSSAYKNTKLAVRQDYGSLHFVAMSDLDLKAKKLTNLTCSFYNRSKDKVQMGAKVHVTRDSAQLEYALARPVEWKQNVWGQDLDLSHDLKVHVGSHGGWKVHADKKLTDNVKLQVTGQLNVNDLHNVHAKDFGVGLH